MLRTLAQLSCLLPTLVFAQTAGGPLVGKSLVVNNSPGDQTDPHVSGKLVAYTSERDGTSEIRYHDLETGADRPIPSSGSFDFVSDISGSTVVFTRVTSSSSIYAFDVFAEAPATEIAPQAGANRRGAVVGGRTVAWQDFSYRGSSLESEIAAFDLLSRTAMRLTDDALLDRTPAVSEDGRVVVWSKCQTDGTGCDIWQAVAEQGGFVSRQLTGAAGEDIQPDTNGRVVVYASTRPVEGVMDRDIFWQPVGGGPEQRLVLAGMDTNPSISGSLVAFERYDASAAQPNYDVYLYDLATLTLYALTRTPQNENLSDISVAADGTVHVVWTVPENGDFNVHAFSFRLPKSGPGTCAVLEDNASAEEVCEAPGERPLLASVEMARGSGKPSEASLAFSGQGQGVLCVDNGFEGERATAGWVTLNGSLEVDPSRFGHAVSRVAKRVELPGDNTLAARVAGKPGSAFRVRVYGPLPEDCGSDDVAPGEQVVPGVFIAPVTVSAGAPVEPGPEELPSVEDGPLAPQGPVGCSAGGGSLGALGALAFASLLLRRR